MHTLHVGMRIPTLPFFQLADPYNLSESQYKTPKKYGGFPLW